MSDKQASAGPRWQFHIGRYRFMWESHSCWCKWGCSDGAKGVGCCWTPWGAYIALKRWQKVPGRPV